MKDEHMKTLLRMTILLSTFLPLPALSATDTCPPEGDGGDSVLNRLKNRSQPPASYQEMTVEQFLTEFASGIYTPRQRERFSWTQKRYIAPRESTGVMLVGYLLGARREAPEASHCHDPLQRNVRLWLGSRRAASPAKRMRARAVILEVTPSGQQTHPGWRLRILQRLARQRAAVRISGWPLYNPEHPQELGLSRGTLWEVHPVTMIEVWRRGQWHAL
jgi:hypothetical protein